jgi:hypothetical protein
VLLLAARGPRVAAVSRDEPVVTLPVPAAGRTVSFVVPRRDRYSFWLAGSTRRRVDVIVDGRPIGGADGQLNNRGQYVELARAVLGTGTHVLELRLEPDRFRPGASGPDYGSGPLVVALSEPPRAVAVLASAEATLLCGRRLDWVETLG